MSKRQNARNTGILWGLILAAISIEIILRTWPIITGIPEMDGMLMVCIGFYISAHAAANFLTAILYELNFRYRASWIGSNLSWLILNALVMLSGLSLVVTGVYRYFSRAF